MVLVAAGWEDLVVLGISEAAVVVVVAAEGRTVVLWEQFLFLPLLVAAAVAAAVALVAVAFLPLVTISSLRPLYFSVHSLPAVILYLCSIVDSFQ